MKHRYRVYLVQYIGTVEADCAEVVPEILGREVAYDETKYPYQGSLPEYHATLGDGTRPRGASDEEMIVIPAAEDQS